MSESPRTSLYLQIAETIRRQILTGELAAGSRLPSVRAVAVQWGCTPGTVERAFKVLAREGLVQSYPGKGTLVSGNASAASQSPWGWPYLVNRAEGFLLEGLRSGFTLAEGEVAVSLALARLRETLERESHPIPTRQPSRSGELRFVGSHDLAIEWIARLVYKRGPSIKLNVTYAGSLGGLIAIAGGEAEVAGIHLWDSQTDSYNAPFVLRVLPGRRILLLTLAHRQMGLILPPGNPQGITGLEGLARPEIRFVNRQPGSGTRVWLDDQLRFAGIPQEAIPGYEWAVNTHLAVTAAVARGEATAGLGIYAAAASSGLHFIPLVLERFDLAIPGDILGMPEILELIEVVRSRELAETLHLLGGYDLRETGTERWLP
jgi:molybdate-binding protein